LSEYEARVYVSLVLEGVSGGRKLGMRGNVPRTKVYATLKKLMERGLVFELPGVPKKFAPKSPAEAFKDCLATLRERISEEMISIEESAKTLSLLEEDYKKRQPTLVPQKGELWIVKSQPEILVKVREMLSRAKRSVVVATTDNGFMLFYKACRKLLDKLNKNNVNILVGAPLNSHKYSFVRELNYICRVKHVNVDSPFLFLCVDACEFLLANLSPDGSDANSGDGIGVISQNSELCGLISLLLPKPIRDAFSHRAIEAYVLNHTEPLEQNAE
jgi:sugar-specific transcriptional regulator TrmB